MSHKHLTSHRYGDISPFFYFYGTRGDKVPLITKQEIGTFTMQSPIESDVYANRTYIKVNHQAIYPRNWELMRPIKQRGQDVPARMRFEFNPYYVYNSAAALFRDCIDRLSGSGDQDYNDNITSIIMNRLFKAIFIMESMASDGSLFPYFNIHLSKSRINQITPNLYNYSKSENFDTFFDTVFVPAVQSFLSSGVQDKFKLSVVLSSESTLIYNISTDSIMNGANIVDSNISLRYAFELMRNSNFNITFSGISSSDASAFKEFASTLFPYFATIYSYNDGLYYNETINVECIAAYQLACAHFFTDDKIDNVYTSDLYFDALRYQFEQLFPTYPGLRWYLNGISHLYDDFSGFIWREACVYFNSGNNKLSKIDTFITLLEWFLVSVNH